MTDRRAVSYVRVSAVMGREQFHSPELQLAAIHDLLARSSVEEVAVVQDIDRTGRDFHREGIQQILQLARDGRIDVVAIYDLSRFGRNLAESLNHIKQLRDLGVTVVSTVEKFDDTPEGQFLLAQFLALAQLYSDQIGRRWKQLMRWRAEHGKSHGAAPLGYRHRAGRTEIDPVDGPAVRELFRLIADGWSVSYARRRLRERIPDKQLSATVVYRVLRNPAYLGLVVLNGETFPGEHEPLIEKPTWDVVQARLRRAAPRGVRAEMAHSLVGVMFCAACGRALQLSTDRGRFRLRCSGQFDADCEGVGTPQVTELEQVVHDAIIEKFSGQPLRPRPRRRSNSDPLLKLAAVREARGRLAVNNAKQMIDDHAFMLADEELAKEEAQALLLVDEARLHHDEQVVRDAAEELIARWPRMTNVERNRAIKLVVRRATCRRGARWREPVADRVTIETYW